MIAAKTRKKKKGRVNIKKTLGLSLIYEHSGDGSIIYPVTIGAVKH
jgi:hypothetical protein